ncbi:MAG: hypothetical protein U0L45_03295 [Alistipes sp.]|nr:hypothetical protein [Alistipes sp.]
MRHIAYVFELTPESVARRLAIYRLINQVMQYGADGAIELGEIYIVQ